MNSRKGLPYKYFASKYNCLLQKWDAPNSQVLAKPLICLGDGHDGIWNLFREIGEKQERIEILDWYHLIENLYKVGGSFQRIEEVKCFLWKGEVEAAISCARRMVRAAS
ncbi:hypothetical protein MiAbB_04857 [Microcystis aeruginosa NIES-4285]|uniref:Transposase IS204/IS1001/IS1096/IS1165 DDE domain-containing protein n=1 Tax=Microcystis aeruginosa NIES-4285 TaxID=2497681 RepID=A0A402DL11_MICAE|nr:hypothetical protein MiAbB_04857 [Microcystis aeruginosa NIES-4285]